jgi:predicted transglutaminase-like cysteine proteinase
MNRADRCILFRIVPHTVGVMLLLAGQAEAETPVSQPLSIAQGVRTVPPLGYIDFCERHADQCGPDAHTMLMLASKNAPLDLSADRNLPSAVEDASGPAAAFNWSSVFRTQPAQKVSANLETDFSAPQVMARALTPPVGGSQKFDTGFTVLTEDRWQMLNDVNVLVNSHVRSVSDLRHYGVSDFWELPMENGGNAGDCEDYVLEKRKLLMARGFPMGALSIALVKTSWNESHAVLLVSTDRGAYVLDNLTPLIRPWAAVAYTWVKWQLPNNPNIWIQPIQR